MKTTELRVGPFGVYHAVDLRGHASTLHRNGIPCEAGKLVSGAEANREVGVPVAGRQPCCRALVGNGTGARECDFDEWKARIRASAPERTMACAKTEGRVLGRCDFSVPTGQKGVASEFPSAWFGTGLRGGASNGWR